MGTRVGVRDCRRGCSAVRRHGAVAHRLSGGGVESLFAFRLSPFLLRAFVPLLFRLSPPGAPFFRVARRGGLIPAWPLITIQFMDRNGGFGGRDGSGTHGPDKRRTSSNHNLLMQSRTGRHGAELPPTALEETACLPWGHLNR